jgi:hypothetical protein
VGLFPKARPSTGGKHRRQPARRRPCVFVPSGSVDWRGVEICAGCDGLRTDPQHSLPETPEQAKELDERRMGER